MARMLTVRLPHRALATQEFTVLEKLTVRTSPDGDTVITCDAYTAARLAGREIFGHVAETQTALEDAIRDNWYGNDCLPTR